MATSKLTDEQYEALLERYLAGEKAPALAREGGVTVGTLMRQARLRGMRKCDRAGAVVLSRRPAADAPDEARDPRSRLSEGRWRALLERRIAGEADADLAAEFEVSEAAIARQARMRGMRKADRADAVYRWRRAPAGPGGRERAFEFRGNQAGTLPHPAPPCGAVPPPRGEGEVEARPPLVLRAAQRPPEGAWLTWLFLGGRGAGKTLAGAEWVAEQARKTGRIALVGATIHDVREVMVEGPSGIRSLPRYAREGRPTYEPTRKRLLWSNGAQAFAFSAEDPESLRGPQFGAAWADELCVWPKPEQTLALLRMGLRLGADPRLVVTTTPKPTAALRRLRAEASCVGTHAPTADNLAHLSPAFLAGLQALYGGTRLAAQELDGRVVESEGALWRAEDLARCRGSAPAVFDRVVVGVDPPASADGNACGIVVAGRRGERAYVLEDATARGLSPLGWARHAAEAAERWGARRVVAEANQGGDMVRAVLAGAGVRCGVELVHARVGKRARAEPVAALYEQGRVIHCGAFPALEEELMGLGEAGGASPAASPDRADALVWAVTELMLGAPAGVEPRIRML